MSDQDIKQIQNGQKYAELMAKGDFEEMARLGIIPADKVEEMRKLYASGQQLQQRMKRGDYSALADLPTGLGNRSPDTPEEGATFRVLMALLKSRPADARADVLLLEKDPKAQEEDEQPVMLGRQDFDSAELSRSPMGSMSLAILYDLELYHDDIEIRRNALQLILSVKNRDLDEVRRTIQGLRNARGSVPSVLAQKIVNEYAKTSNTWATAALNCRAISKSDERAAAQRVGDLEDRWQQFGTSSPGDGNQPQLGPRVSDIQSQLRSQDALVEYAEAWLPKYRPNTQSPLSLKQNPNPEDIHYVAYVLRQDGLSSFDLGPVARIDNAISEYRHIVTGYSANGETLSDDVQKQADLAKVRGAARQVYSLIWQPVEAALSKTEAASGHVFISPDGNLSLVPFDGLVASDGKYLIESWHISYVSSGRQLLQHRPPPQSVHVTIFANPRLNQSTDQSPSALAAPVTSPPATNSCLAKTFHSLPNTQREADSICHMFGANCTEETGVDATEAKLKAVKGPTVLHLATHGYYVEPDKRQTATLTDEFQKRQKYRFLRSGLILGDFNGRGPEDGVVTSLEVALLDLEATGLVVVSACDSGIGDITPGDNISGMRSAFHVAGARAVISSLWTLDDAMERQLMEKFYSYLAGTRGVPLSTSEALRQAKLDLRQSEKEQGRDLHPFFWSSLVLEGEDVVFPQSGH